MLGIIGATSIAVPRADVGYCIHTLSRRLTKTKNWIVAVKTLMVLHRILREGDPSFREELLVHSRRRKLFQIPEFRDESSQLACDCSSWIRNYATYLEERLECYRVLGFDIETERFTIAPGSGKAYSRTRVMHIDELLDQLPAMQQLLHRLIACQPEGVAYINSLIQHALTLVLKESLKIYSVINDGIIKLVDAFFDLSKDDAVNALNIYKKAGKQTEQLIEFYNLGKHLRAAMNIQFPSLTQPPPSFLVTMEEHIQGASSNSSVLNINLEHQDMNEQSPREIKEVENKEALQDHGPESKLTKEVEEVENKEALQDQGPVLKPIKEVEEVLPLISIDNTDCPDLKETTSKFAELDVSEALPIIKAGKMFEKTSNCWELAVVTSSSNTNNNANALPQGKLGGGFDKMILYSLYEDNIAKKHIQNQYGLQYDPYHCHHHLLPNQAQFVSGGVAPPLAIQTTIMHQQTQQQQHMMNQQPCHQQYQRWYQQQNICITYNHQRSSNQYLQRQVMDPKPYVFGDGINNLQSNHGLI
uniref:putative clathrin assembly protein At5g57200 n=1 Tax=Erigeron canadensis TaxID=72917 RepID=UPI001CB94A63|nr:putative clathrin assembly protein At5g57200 [Erigeron canadensis]